MGFRNFRHVKTIDEPTQRAMLHEIEVSGLWLHNRGRQKIPVQAETNTICLRVYDAPAGYTGKNWDVHAVKDDLIDRFPLIAKFLYDFASEQDSGLARAMIVRLQPWGQVYRHHDYGSYYAARDRFHLVLDSDGSDMTSGDEACILHERELWWFNNSLEHQSFNHSADWRIHIIFDIETNRNKTVMT